MFFFSRISEKTGTCIFALKEVLFYSFFLSLKSPGNVRCGMIISLFRNITTATKSLANYCIFMQVCKAYGDEEVGVTGRVKSVTYNEMSLEILVPNLKCICPTTTL